MGDHLNVKGLKAAATPPNGAALKIGIIHTRWNDTVVDALVEGCMTSLSAANVSKDNITTINVPGAFELPYAASQMIKGGNFDAIVCVGTLIKGSTMHFEYICDAVSHQIMRLGVNTGTPVVFGVLTCLTEDQALARAGLPTSDGKNDGHNHGLDWGTTAVEMALLKGRSF